ncbi:hypothetical protein [Pseudacidovorax intermedius]|uniref:Uncharacterized protein n=1 Tax=Pseudacidovorax intermedius TaxID=433924 RepID=A0A147GR95_9BURK|nr:hypothetical protein [Pseudacidovorax intermedius]KTT18926.1 hypothetical protein NS331_15045 [Pseudacidovorax intermedius]
MTRQTPLNPLVVADSVTKLQADARGAVAVAASHAGLFAAHEALAAGVVAVVLNDAGVGLAQAGIGGLALCDRHGVPCTAVDHRSARIGDGADHLRRGRLSHVNSAAAHLGLHVGMSVADAIERLRIAKLAAADPGDPPQEARENRALPGALRTLVLMDSASLVTPRDAGAVVLTGSHGGLLGGQASTAIKVDVFAAVYNDAGVGMDDAGISRMPALDARGIAGATVAAGSARIGDGRSTYESGVLSHINHRARALGARVGMRADAFADLMGRATAGT